MAVLRKRMEVVNYMDKSRNRRRVAQRKRQRAAQVFARAHPDIRLHPAILAGLDGYPLDDEASLERDVERHPEIMGLLHVFVEIGQRLGAD